MRVILVAASLIVAVAGGSGHAEDSSPTAPLAPASSGGPREGGEPSVEEKATGWLKLKRGTRVRLMVEEGGPMRVVVGRLLSSDPTTVTVDARGGPQRLSRDRLFHLSYRTGGNRKKGAAITAAGLVGMIACFAVFERELDRTLGPDRGNGQGLGLICGIPGLGALGFGIVSLSSDWHEWHDAKPDGLTVADRTSSRRASVALRLRVGPR